MLDVWFVNISHILAKHSQHFTTHWIRIKSSIQNCISMLQCTECLPKYQRCTLQQNSGKYSPQNPKSTVKTYHASIVQ